MIHKDILDLGKRLRMDLRIYLFNKRLSVTKFSKILGCSRIHLSEIVNGRRVPSLVLAKSIERETNGEVTAKELLKKIDDAQLLLKG